MIYKNFQDFKISALGFGAMRLPVLNGDAGAVDEKAVGEMIRYAVEHGINYFDTAWGYHNGQSELVMGRALSAYPRERYYLASKFPGYDLSNLDRVEEIFEKQLQKCGVDYFDFYLIHNVCELNIDGYLDPKYGIVDYLLRQKQNGRIRRLGFSAHGSLSTMKRFLDAYGADMEFCQLQLNYLDWTLQNAEEKLKLVREYRLPVWVMEPLRGGRLASLTPEQENRLRALRPEESVPAWAFRFLQSLSDVTVTLSGMSNMEQLRQNVEIYETEKPLSQEETTALLDVAQSILGDRFLPCTSCRYCTTHCPMQLNIPELLALSNEHAVTGGGFIVHMAMAATPDDKKPSACLGCRKCEEVCPQQIRISEAMSDFARRLNG